MSSSLFQVSPWIKDIDEIHSTVIVNWLCLTQHAQHLTPEYFGHAWLQALEGERKVDRYGDNARKSKLSI